jgi:hypothetical protein
VPGLGGRHARDGGAGGDHPGAGHVQGDTADRADSGGVQDQATGLAGTADADEQQPEGHAGAVDEQRRGLAGVLGGVLTEVGERVPEVFGGVSGVLGTVLEPAADPLVPGPVAVVAGGGRRAQRRWGHGAGLRVQCSCRGPGGSPQLADRLAGQGGGAGARGAGVAVPPGGRQVGRLRGQQVAGGGLRGSRAASGITVGLLLAQGLVGQPPPCR